MSELDPAVRQLLETLARLERALDDRENEIATLELHVKALADLPIAAWWTDANLKVTRTEGAVMREMEARVGTLVDQPVSELMRQFFPNDNAAKGMRRYKDILSGVPAAWPRRLLGRRLRCYGEPIRSARGDIGGIRVLAVDETDFVGATSETHEASPHV